MSSHTAANDARAPAKRPLDNTVYPTGLHSVNQPICFSQGRWQGQTIRAELHEIQQIERPKIYADIGEDPLGTPPVVALRLFRADQGAQGIHEALLSVKDIGCEGLVCNVDLMQASVAPMEAVVEALGGTRTVHPHVVDYKNKDTLVFVFLDLEVQTTGLFRLRYKFFDLSSKVEGDEDTIIQARCYGPKFLVRS